MCCIRSHNCHKITKSTPFQAYLRLPPGRGVHYTLSMFPHVPNELKVLVPNPTSSCHVIFQDRTTPWMYRSMYRIKGKIPSSMVLVWGRIYPLSKDRRTASHISLTKTWKLEEKFEFLQRCGESDKLKTGYKLNHKKVFLLSITITGIVCVN